MASKALQNATDLLDEADGLASFGRHARAYALGVLAAEEFGKHLMAVGALGRARDDTTFWSDFWRRFTDHRPKYTNLAAMVAWFLEDPNERREFLAELKSHVNSDLARKMSSLYVDVDESGSVVLRKEAVPSESVFGLLHVLDVIVRGYANYLKHVDWVTAFQEGSEGAVEFQRALGAKDAPELARLLQMASTNERDTPDEL